MAFLDGIKETWHQRKIKQRLDEHLSPEVRNYKDVQTIGILFDADREDERAVVLDYSKRLQRDHRKKVTLLGYRDVKELSGEEPYPCFCKKDLDWSQTPKGEQVEEFIRASFDWLLALHMHDCPPLEYLSAASAARFRIGHYREGKTDFYDWMLHGEAHQLPEFLKQLEKYRTKIK